MTSIEYIYLEYKLNKNNLENLKYQQELLYFVNYNKVKNIF